MHRMRIGFVAALASLAAGQAAAASCDGWYEMMAIAFNGAPPPAPVTWKFGDFDAEADCSGIDNEHCHAKAAARLFLCYRAHYEARETSKRPEQCGGIDGYSLEDISLGMGETACCSKKARGYDAVEVALYGRVDGESACSLWTRGVKNYWQSKPRSEMIARAYEIDCAAIRAALCPKYAKRR